MGVDNSTMSTVRHVMPFNAAITALQSHCDKATAHPQYPPTCGGVTSGKHEGGVRGGRNIPERAAIRARPCPHVTFTRELPPQPAVSQQWALEPLQDGPIGMDPVSLSNRDTLGRGLASLQPFVSLGIPSAGRQLDRN